MTGRKSVIWGAVAWATLSVVIFLIQFLTSSAAPMVNVRWAEDVDLAQREQLEQAFLLEPFVNREATTWTYELLDTSPDNIQALVEHASVSDTHHIERTEFRLSDEAELGDTSWWAAQRVRMLRPVAWVLWPVIPYFAAWQNDSGGSAVFQEFQRPTLVALATIVEQLGPFDRDSRRDVRVSGRHRGSQSCHA